MSIVFKPHLSSWFRRPAKVLLLLPAFLLLQSIPGLAAYPPFGVDQCPADRMYVSKGNTSLGCTAADVSITRLVIIPNSGTGTGTSSPDACVAGTSPEYDFDLVINFATPQRWDIGIFLVNDGKNPLLPSLNGGGGPATCSVDVLATPAHPTLANPSPLFQDLDGVPVGYPQDTCGDGSGAINGGTGSAHHRMNSVPILCKSTPFSGGKLAVPFVVTWDNQATPSGGICSSNLDPVPNTVSKCNSPAQALQADVLDIVIVPPLSKDDGKSSTSIGETNIYEITVQNNTGNILTRAVLTDPAVSGLSVSSVTCSPAAVAPATVNGVCPSAGLLTVANLQGGGIPLPDQPIASSLTFTVTGMVTSAASGSLTNTARVTVTAPSIVNPGTTISGYSEASDTDTVGNRPTLTLVKTVTNNDGGSKTINDFSLTATGATTTLSGLSGSTAVTAVPVPAGNYVLSETLASGGTISGYVGGWSCTGQTSFAGSTVTISAGQDVTCTVNNNDIAANAPSLTIRKITKAATTVLGAGTFIFNGTATNGNGIPTSGSSFSATTVTTNTPVTTAAVSLGSTGVDTIFTEISPDATWVLTGASCTDSNGIASGNGTAAFTVPFNQTGSTASISGISIPANGIAIPAARIKSGAVLVCDVTNARSTLKLTKSTQPTGSSNTFSLSIDGVIRTSPTVVDGGSTLDIPVSVSATHTIGEDAIVPDNFFTGGNKYQLIYTCRDVYGNTTVEQTYFDVSTLGNAAYTSGNLNIFAALSAVSPLDANNLQINCTLRNNSGVSLAIKKVAFPTDSAVNFPFTITGLPNITLSGANDNVSNVKTISVSKNTTYTITEDLSGLPDWVFVSSSCNINGVVTSPGNPAVIFIPNAVSVAAQCYFVNKRKTALTIKKTVIGNNTDQFDLKINNTSVINTRTGTTGTFLNGDTGKVVLGTGPFSPTVSETINANYNTILTCTDNATGLAVSGINGISYTGGLQSLSLSDAQQVTCEFTNLRKTYLTVAKTVSGPLVQGTDKFVISINKGGPSLTTAVTSSTATDVNTLPTPGKFQVYPAIPATETYTFTERGALGSPDTDLTKYTTTYGCNNATAGGTASIPAGTPGTSVTLTPAIGDDFTCTFTNTAKPPTITLTKTTKGNPGAASPSFAFILLQGVTTIGSGSTTTTTEDLPSTVGTYTATAATAVQIIESTIPAGWTLSDASCSGLQGADVIDTTNLATSHYITIPATSVVVGANIQCNFTNKKNATITVKKALIPTSDAGTFNLKVNGTTVAAAAGHNGTGSTTVAPGSVVTVSEEGAAGTDLNKYSSSLTCKDTVTSLYVPGLSPADNISYMPDVPAIFTAPSFIPDGGQQIECTFTNSLQPKLRLVKEVVGIVNTTDKFTISISPSANIGATVVVDAIDGSRSTATVSDTNGDGGTVYTFAETGTNLAGYTTTYSCTNDATGSTTTIPVTATAGTSFTITPNYGDDIVCTIRNVAKNASIVLKKSLSVARNNDDNQFTMEIRDKTSGSEVVYTSNLVTTGTGSTVDVGTGIATFTTTTAKTYTLGEALSGTIGDGYGARIFCANNDEPVTSPPFDGSLLFNPSTTTQDLTLNLGDNYVCTLVNGMPPGAGAPLTIEKRTVGGTGSFNFTVVNGVTTLPVVPVATTSTNPQTSAAQTLPNISSPVTVTESAVPGWTTTAGSCTDDATQPAKWKAIGQTVTIPAVESGKSYSCSFTNTLSGFSITGTVFKDSGTGGGTANNGIKDGAESGISQVTVKLTDCGSTVYSSTTTDGNGNYSLSTLGVPTSPSEVCIVETNLEGYLSTGASFPVLDPVATYDRPTDKITLALAAGTSYSGMDFGDVPVNRFLTDGDKTGLPGTTVSYPHIFVAGSGGTVSFSLPVATAMPAITGWGEVVYRDLNCDGTIVSGAGDGPVITVPATEITVAEGDRVCLILKEFIPANAPIGSSNLVPIAAEFTYTNAVPSLTANYARQDVTRVSDVALEVLKSVRNLTTGGLNGPWLTSNTAKSGDTLEYRITYVNNGITSISNLVIQDSTPAYTTFLSADCGVTPIGLTCTVPVPVQPSVNGTGGISWTFVGSLTSAVPGTVTYQVKVE